MNAVEEQREEVSDDEQFLAFDLLEVSNEGAVRFSDPEHRSPLEQKI